jgi:hypothetical protein
MRVAAQCGAAGVLGWAGTASLASADAVNVTVGSREAGERSYLLLLIQ